MRETWAKIQERVVGVEGRDRARYINCRDPGKWMAFKVTLAELSQERVSEKETELIMLN